MNERSLNNSIVKKNWGQEYLAYRNEHLAIWFLNINFGEETSLHCHCKKNTGLIVLDGIARVSFLNNSIMLKGLDKIQIFKSRFHSTKALSKQGVSVLEVESPEDKTDLVRLKDKYGRKGLPYEGVTNYYPKDFQCLDIEWGKKIFHSKCEFLIETITDKRQLIGREFEETVVILYGGIISLDEQLICPPGDVIASHNLDIMLEEFNTLPKTQILSIKRNEPS